MSSASQVTTFSDLYTDLENRVRVTTGVTATENQAKRYINIALHDMHLGVDYRLPWAERQGRLITQQQYTTGTVSITQGSQTLTGASTAWNTNNAFGLKNMRANGKILVGGTRTPYVIQTVTGDASATISSKFTDADVTATTYVYFEDEYDLASDFLRPVDIQRFSDAVPIDLISRTEFRRRYPSNSVPGRPGVATIQDYAPSGSTTPVRRVRFAQPPSTFYTIPYAYITSNLAVSSAGAAQSSLSADTDEPIIPLRYRHALVFHALYHWYRDKKDDDRAAEAKQEYTELMLRMIGDQDIGGARPQIRVRVSNYVRAARFPYRSGGGRGRYDVNGRFDRLED